MATIQAHPVGSDGVVTPLLASHHLDLAVTVLGVATPATLPAFTQRMATFAKQPFLRPVSERMLC